MPRHDYVKIIKECLAAMALAGVLVLSAPAQSDSVQGNAGAAGGSLGKVSTQPPVRMPPISERLAVLGVGLVAFGGVAVLLNLRRTKADRAAGITHRDFK